MNHLTKVYTSTLSCEAIFRKLDNGDYIIVSQCGGEKEPDIENRVYLFRSTDGGKTWSSPVKLYEDGNAVYQTEVSVIGKKIYIWGLTHNGKFLNSKNFLLVSGDYGYTWQLQPFPLQFEGLLFVRGMIGSEGRLLWPYQFCAISKQEERMLMAQDKYIWNSSVMRTECGVICSGDEGSTFSVLGHTYVPHFIQGKNVWQWPEPTIVELSDGKLLMLLRVNGADHLFRSISEDGGKSWSEPEITDICNPGNKPKLIKMENGNICLINTPNKGRLLTDRHPLCIWVSNDDLRSWYYKAEIDNTAPCLSYPDGIADGSGKVLFSYEVNRKEIWFAEHCIE